MNMQALLKQAQKMQKDMAEKEQELSSKTYETSMGGGAVKVVVKGDFTVESIQINEDLLEKDSKEDLEDMLISAFNEVLAKANEDKEKTMNAITGGIKMPGGF
ncbi:YbaB/EbfC family nucleoid-associated protein [Amedibacillus sp. YH-ame10]